MVEELYRVDLLTAVVGTYVAYLGWLLVLFYLNFCFFSASIADVKVLEGIREHPF